MKPIISVKEARKLLGKEHENLTDEEVVELIEQTHELAKLALDVARDKLAREKRDEKTERPTDQSK
ncbi:MAG: hypothetical protein JWN12_57 [Candidatus Saccharibacteria bacterium]|nr:hypothetical protein [Candidatus Saccharibacteria bacterium]